MRINIEKLESIRKAYGEGIREFVKRIGVSHQWYYNIINGQETQLYLETINKISKNLKIKWQDLIK